MKKAKIGTRAIGVTYIARNLCLTSKRFKSLETANAWLDRVGAGDRLFYDYEMTDGGWVDNCHTLHPGGVKAMADKAWAHLPK